MAFIEMISAIAKELLSTLLTDYKFFPIYIVIILIVKSKYDKHMDFQTNLYGETKFSMRQIIEETVLYGLITGVIMSMVIVSAGITISTNAFSYLFLILLFLSLINIRFISFSYAAGILGIVSLIFRINNVNVPSLLVLTAILHISESLLIFYTADRSNIPVFLKQDNKITGAYIIQRFWLVPLVFITFVVQNSGIATDGIHIYKWLDTIRPDLVKAGVAALGLDCIIGIAAYSDIAIASQPKKRSRRTSLYTLVYGLVLLLFAIGSFKTVIFQVAGALFAIIGRELVYIKSHSEEKNGKPLFESVRRGMKIFDVLKGSHAEKMGIEKGETLLNVNGRDVQTEEGLKEALKDYPRFVWITTNTCDGKEKTYEYKSFPEGVGELGIIIVPREHEITYNVDNFENLIILKNLVARYRATRRNI